VQLAKEVMHFISSEADKASMALARSRGAFPNFKLSMYKDGIPLRNASRTTISPTGSISMIAGCSSSIEPAFALSFIKNVLGGKELLVVNEPFERCAKKEGFYSDELMKRIANQGTIQELEDVPEHIRDIFRINFDVSPYWHIRMQAAFQEFTDNAVSKTVNFPNWITTKEVGEIFLLAYKLGCKGITAYRDGSKTGQVMTVSLKPSGEKEEKKYCPECDVVVENKACVSCGFVIV
jgi:ribonucleoside-diphosphate reductase alpha chain